MTKVSGKIAVAVLTATALTAGPVASAEAASHRNARKVTFGHWYTHKRSQWEVVTRNERHDKGAICLKTNGPRWANVRIYAYDSRGRRIGTLSRDHVRFWLKCQRLALPASRHADRFLFRINVSGDGMGEKARSVGVKR